MNDHVNRREKRSFKGMDLQNADFSGADLRGADFSFSNVQGANFSKSVTGIRKASRAHLFILSFLLSLLSGYVAMLTGNEIQFMMRSDLLNLRIAGYVTIVLFLFFFCMAFWKGVTLLVGKIFLFVVALLIVCGFIFYFSGVGNGIGIIHCILALILMLVMFLIGTMARAAAGTLASNVLFVVVAVAGGVFGRRLGGGISSVAMALACAIISKQALNAGSKPSILRNIALTIGCYFGTSFKHANLADADFREATIKNTNFSNADITGVKWNNAQKQYNLPGELN